MARRKQAEQSEPTVRVSRRQAPLFFIGMLFSGIAVLALAMYIGKLDQGQIDVSATIQASNEGNKIEGDGSPQVGVISNALRSMPNGGLEPQSNQHDDTPSTNGIPVVNEREDVMDIATGTEPETTGEISSE